MDKNTLRRMAGIRTIEESLAAPGYTPSFAASEFRRLAGLKPLPEAKGSADDEPVDAPKDEEAEDEIPAIVTKIAAKAEGLKGDDMVAMITKVYDAGFTDGQAAGKEDEATEVKESAENLMPSFQVDGASHVGGIAIALADHGIEAFVVKGMGGVGHEYFFNFKNEADMNKGYEIAKQVGGALPPKPVAKPEAPADAAPVAVAQ